MKRFINIFDLDGTLIDSSHRINKEGNASLGLDFDYWMKNSNHKMIMKDKLLPLVSLYKEFQKTEFTNIAVTAREMSIHDFDYLDMHGLQFKMVLHRGDSKELDHVLKEKKLIELFNSGDYIPFMAFDDKNSNLEVFKKFGFKCVNAIDMNKKLYKIKET